MLSHVLSPLTLVSVHIGRHVQLMNESIFMGCSSLKSIVIPDDVAYIDKGLFYECFSLESIVIGKSVASIGIHAFQRCFSLTSIKIPDSVVSIGYQAFTYCKALASVDLGNNITTLGEACFGSCESLTYIMLPSSLTDIEELAFSNCVNLRVVNFTGFAQPRGNMLSFQNCNMLSDIYVPKDYDGNTFFGYQVTKEIEVIGGEKKSRVMVTMFCVCAVFALVFEAYLMCLRRKRKLNKIFQNGDNESVCALSLVE